MNLTYKVSAHRGNKILREGNDMQYNKRGAIAVYSKNEEGTCDELVVDLYNLRFEYTGNLEEQELRGKTVGGIKIFEVPMEFFRQFCDVVDAQFDGSYYTEEKTYPQRLAESRRRAAEDKKKPVVGHETIKKAIRCELSQQELDDILSYDYRYEKDDYGDFPVLYEKIHAVMEGTLGVNYFTSWCVLLMRCFFDAMDTRSRRLQDVYNEIGDYFDGVAFMASDISEQEKCRELRELIAFLKYHEYLVANIRSKSAEKFQTAGVVTYVSFAFSVQDGERSLYRVCVADEIEKKVNYMFAADFDFDERINYTLLSEAEFRELPSLTIDDYALDISLGIDYALEKSAERKINS